MFSSHTGFSLTLTARDRPLRNTIAQEKAAHRLLRDQAFEYKTPAFTSTAIHPPLLGPLRTRILAPPPVQFNFTPIVCVVTGAGRPGVVREAALAATASDLAKDGTLKDSLGNTLSGHAQAQGRKLRGQRAREQGHRRQRHRRKGARQQHQDGTAAASNVAGPGDDVGADAGFRRENGEGGEQGSGGAGDWDEKGGSVTEQVERVAGDGSGRWEEDTFGYDGRIAEEEQEGEAGEGHGADLVRALKIILNIVPNRALPTRPRTPPHGVPRVLPTSVRHLANTIGTASGVAFESPQAGLNSGTDREERGE